MSEPVSSFGRPIQIPRPDDSKNAHISSTDEDKKSRDLSKNHASLTNELEAETSTIPAKQATINTDSEAVTPFASGREGDNTFGRVPHIPPPEIKASQYSLADLEREFIEAETEEIFEKPIELPLAWLSGFWLILLLFAGIMGWFIFAQILSTIQIVLKLPFLLQIISWIFIAFLAFIVFYPISRLLLAYQKLKPVKQIRMTRILIKNASLNQLQAAKKNILEYLNNYPLEKHKFIIQLEKMGLTETVQKKLQRTKAHLLEESPQTTFDWLKEFERDFVEPLDTLAKERIQHYAKLLALKSALSPNALIDIIVVLYNGFSLLKDICIIYQVRIGRLGIIYLLGIIIFQSYVAGQIQNHISSAEGYINNLLQETILDGISAKIASLITVKAGEAAIHYLFLRRIGHTMMVTLRPLGLKSK